MFITLCAEFKFLLPLEFPPCFSFQSLKITILYYLIQGHTTGNQVKTVPKNTLLILFICRIVLHLATHQSPCHHPTPHRTPVSFLPSSPLPWSHLLHHQQLGLPQLQGQQHHQLQEHQRSGLDCPGCVPPGLWQRGLARRVQHQPWQP